MSKPKYSVVIYRHIDEEGNMEEIMDRWISADTVIDLLQSVEEDGVAGAEEEETEEEEVEEEPEPEPVKKKAAGTRGKPATWDKEKAKEMLEDGEKAGDIADAVGTSVGNIYQYKSELKKKGELLEVDENTPPVNSALQDQVNDMVANGDTYEQVLSRMRNSMSEREVQEAFSYAQKQLI